MTKIVHGELEFVALADSPNDSLRIVFCRKRPKNKIIGFFTPWRRVRPAYHSYPGLSMFMDSYDMERVLDRVNTWEDFKEWTEEQKGMSAANRSAAARRWDSLK